MVAGEVCVEIYKDVTALLCFGNPQRLRSIPLSVARGQHSSKIIEISDSNVKVRQIFNTMELEENS